jgi:hypothetical protein
MRRIASLGVALGIASLLMPIGGAFAESGGTSPSASCVGILSNAETHLFPHGFVGQEVSGAATSAPGVVGDFSKVVAKNHGESLEGCIVE